MPFQTPDGFDPYRRNEPSASLLGTQLTITFDAYRRTEPSASLLREAQIISTTGIASDTPHVILGHGAC